MPEHELNSVQQQELRQARSRFVDFLHPEGLLSLVLLNGGPGYGTTVGFYRDRERFHEHVAGLNGLGGVYVNLHELDPSLYDRSARTQDKYEKCAKRRYSASHVVKLKWLLVDLDPIRPSGTPSSDEELRIAGKRANEVLAYLREQWQAEPATVMSGNGLGLLYPIDLPPDSTLTADVLSHLQEKFSDNKVDIDTSVADAARLTRLPSTLNRKGSETEERPWRFAEALFIPEDRHIVEATELQALVGIRAKPAATPARKEFPARLLNAGSWTRESLIRYLEEDYKEFGGHGWGYEIKGGKNIREYDNGEIFLLQQCPRYVHHIEYRMAIWLHKGQPCVRCPSAKCDGENKLTWEDFDALIRPKKRLPEIRLKPPEVDVVRAAILAMTNCKDVYQRGGLLVEVDAPTDLPVLINRPPDAERIVVMPSSRLRTELSRIAKWRRKGGAAGNWVHTWVPAWLVKAVESHGRWPLPALEGIVESPVLRSDGSILEKPGYDPSTGLYLSNEAEVATVDDPRKARDILLDIIQDFPFAAEGHRAAWMSGLLTSLSRYAFGGPAPLHIFDANVRGSGKSMLADLISVVVTGRPMPRTAAPETEDEWRKRITAIALAGDPLLLIDNIAATLASPSLDAALTSVSWEHRILGRSEMVTLPLNTVRDGQQRDARRRYRSSFSACATGEPAREARRTDGLYASQTVGLRCAKETATPGSRVRDTCGLLQGGRPDQALKPIGSFEAWSDLVRSAVVWAGFADPVETRTALTDTADTERSQLAQLMDGWQLIDPDGDGKTVAEVLRVLEAPVAKDDDQYDALRTVVNEICSGSRQRSAALGQKLRQFKGRVLGGRMFASKTRRNVQVWYLTT